MRGGVFCARVQIWLRREGQKDEIYSWQSGSRRVRAPDWSVVTSGHLTSHRQENRLRQLTDCCLQPNSPLWLINWIANIGPLLLIILSVACCQSAQPQSGLGEPGARQCSQDQHVSIRGSRAEFPAYFSQPTPTLPVATRIRSAREFHNEEIAASCCWCWYITVWVWEVGVLIWWSQFIDIFWSIIMSQILSLPLTCSGERRGKYQMVSPVSVKCRLKSYYGDIKITDNKW